MSVSPEIGTVELAPTVNNASLSNERPLLCPLCHCAKWKQAGSVRGVPLSLCDHCKLLGTTHFLDRTNTVDDLYGVGEENYAIYKRQYLAARCALYARVLPSLKRFQQTKRLLEVGSGYGYFLELAAKDKWIAEGVEISPYCCKIARERGSKVTMGSLESADLPLNSYDVVILWDVIEHFPQPDQIIRVCRQFLRTGGVLVMRTPDGRALESTLNPLRVLYRNLAYPANTAEHIFHFTPRDLIALVAKSGYAVESVDCSQYWSERVVSANNMLVWLLRWLIMRNAQWQEWPYECVISAVKK